MKQFIISTVVLFIVSLLLGFVVHGFVLAGEYSTYPNLMRTEADAQRHFPAMLLANALLAIGITGIYRRGREVGKNWLGQGFRFGLWFAVASSVPMYLIYYAVEPWGLTTVCKQIVLDGIATVVLGLLVAALNRATASVAATAA